MASFCSKCGAELSPNTQFCAACGASLAAAVAVVAPAQLSAAPVQCGGNAHKIILIIVAVFVGLGILGAGAFGFFVWRVAHAVHVSGSGDQVKVHTAGGTLTANSTETYSVSNLGTDIYPGAQTGKGSMRMTLPTGSMVSAVYVTADSKDQVLSFYMARFGSEASVFDSPDGTVLTPNKGQQESVVATITKGSSEYDGKTKIHIVHTTSTKTQ
ncbi:MAG TPA: zinc ribbon domain-containing protein [Terracidiphilus sp.]|nr:zinc ribbon domain-containing protein [Terracidiphilus sp.]